MPASYSLAPHVDGEVAACSGAFGCAEAIAGSILALMLWAGLSTGVLFAPRSNVRAALSALRTEMRAVRSERDALTTFAADVESLPATGPVSTVETGGVGVVGAQGRSAGMAKLRDAYRETMMSVDHYERDYGEPLRKNLANELGDGVAGAVLANDELSPQVKRAVVAAAEEGQVRRDQYLDTLSTERERLERAGDRLEAVESTCVSVDGKQLRRREFDELEDRFERLDAGRRTLTAALDRRQEQLHEGVTFGWQRRDSESVYRYLYRDIDATYPVLADGSRVLERMDDIESRLTTALTAKV